jgi:hypothetical protein
VAPAAPPSPAAVTAANRGKAEPAAETPKRAEVGRNEVMPMIPGLPETHPVDVPERRRTVPKPSAS